MARLIPLKDKTCDKCEKRHTTVLLGVPVMYCFKECQRHETPEVDAVPVVRCKDCKWWKEETEYEWDGETEFKQQLCTEHEAYFEPDDFCSYGERREDGANR